MQDTVVVQPLLAMTATKSPKPFSSAAIHSVLVMRHGSGCASAAEDSIIKKPAAADSTNATADEARNWGPPTVENTLALERNFSEMKRLGHQTLEETRSH